MTGQNVNLLIVTTMIRKLALAMVLVAGGILSTPAQSFYDDDIYYNASKVKKEKQEATQKAAEKKAKANYVPNKSVDYPGADTYTVQGDSLRDVDEYNRRTPSGSSVADGSISGNDDTFAYTRRIEKFYNPSIVDDSGDENLQYLYYSSEAEREQKEDVTNVNIYVESPSWGWSSYWPYYSSYAWGPSWAWNSWYGWTSPSWSWYWNFGPSWAWGPSWSWTWGPSWGCGPSWGWGPALPPPHRPGWGGHGPGWNRPPVRPGQQMGNRPGFGNRPGGNTSLGPRPSRPTTGGNAAVSTRRQTRQPGFSTNNIRRNSILRNTINNSQSQPGSRPGIISGNRNGNHGIGAGSSSGSSTTRPSARPSSGNRNNSNSSGYNRNNSSSSNRSSFNSGSSGRNTSSGGSRTGGGHSGGGGGRRR